MDFIVYPPSRKEKQPYPSELVQYRSKLRSNVDSMMAYYQRAPHTFNNQSAGQRILSLVEEFFGTTPNDTYYNVKIRTDLLCGTLGIVSRQPRCDYLPLIGLHDIVVSHTLGAPIWAGERLTNSAALTPIVCVAHNSDSLSLEDYVSDANIPSSLWYIDLALLAAMYHQWVLEEGNVHQFLTNVIHCKNAQRYLDIATANNIPIWVSDLFVEDFSNPAPYREHNLTQLGNRAEKAWQDYFSKFERASVDVLAHNGIWDNVTIPTNKINDYYVDHLAWVSAFVDVRYFKRLKSISDAMGLDINYLSVQRFPERILTDNKIRRLTATLPDYQKSQLASLLAF